MSITIIQGDCRQVLAGLPAGRFQTCVTSPPYFGLRDYGVSGQIGLEPTPDAFIAEMVAVFREVRRVLRDDGTLWLNLGDSYAGSWGAQSRGGAPSEKSTLKGNGHLGGGPKIKALSAVQIAASPQLETGTGSLKRTPGYKAKDLMMIPARVALALQADGWWLRSEIIWAKPNPMPESVTDRPTSAHEKVFLFAKSERYFYDADAIREGMAESSIARLAQPNLENQAGSMRANGGAKTNGPMKAVAPKADKQRGHSRRHAGFNDRWDAMEKAEQTANGRNARNVWNIATRPFKEAHFATFPPELPERCIKAGSRPGDHVLDPFGGAGTTGLVADRLQRHATLIELNPEYAGIAERRIVGDAPLFGGVA